MTGVKILLIQTPARESGVETLVVPPLGLAYLAAVAREAGHAVSILDAFAEGLSWEAFEARVRAAGADLIGITGMTPIADAVQRAIRLCRPHARWLVLGGPHATAQPDRILADNPELDFAVIGEGEVTFRELLERLEGGSSPDGLAGLVTRSGAGPARPLIDQLDDLPSPARDLLPNDRYRYPLSAGRRITTMISSRGCPYGCIFCDKNVFGSRWRARSADSVLAEIDRVVRDFGVQTLIFYDDLFTLKPDRLRAICEGLIARKYDLTWKAEGRVDLADAELLRLMRRAGCDTLAYGVESANPRGLEYLGKRTTPDQIRTAFRATRAAGIKTVGYFILGIPVETYEDALRTIRFATEIRTDYAQFSILSPMPGTRLYREAVARGWYREIAAQNVNDKDRLRPVVISENWDEARLIAIVHQAHRMFYLRPGYIARRLLALRSGEEARNLAQLGWKMVRYVFGRLT